MSNVITLPRWLMHTRTMQLNSIDVVLILALVLKVHGTAQAVRDTAVRIRTKVCMEHQPKMKALSRLADDGAVLRAAYNIVQRATDALGIHPGAVFEPKMPDAPRCHYKAMRLAGEPGARHWACQCCSHTKPVVL